MAEHNSERVNSPASETDNDFEPSADMLVHDYDDEQTLDDEENQSSSDAGNELADLQKEGDMPIEELLRMYGYNSGESATTTAAAAAELQESRSSSEAEIISNQDLTLDKEEVARDLLKDHDADSDEEMTEKDLLENVEFSTHTARLLRSQEGGEMSDDDSADVDYEPTEIPDWKKSVPVGPEFQADVFETTSSSSPPVFNENDDRLVWDPTRMDEAKVEEYLGEVQSATVSKDKIVAQPTLQYRSDDEQALYLLMQCDYNIDEALRRQRMGIVPPSDPMSLWSEEECQNFENGLKTYGKDFFLIQQNKVRTRSTGELVQFYYLWKKTERHDIFASKNRLEKRKYTLNPGTTDYMEHFIDEQESQSFHRDRPTSPTLTLLMGDHKRHIENPSKTPTQEEVAAVLEMVHNVVDPKILISELPELPDLPSPTSGHTNENQVTSIFPPVETINTDKDCSDVAEPPSKRSRTEMNSCSNCLRNVNVPNNNLESTTYSSSGHLDQVVYSEHQTDNHSAAYLSGPLSSESGNSFNINFSPSSNTARSFSSGTFAH